jgi:hypothetical protein
MADPPSPQKGNICAIVALGEKLFKCRDVAVQNMDNKGLKGVPQEMVGTISRDM